MMTRQKIVAGIEAKHACGAANREQITRFQIKIQGTPARIWGEGTPTTVENV